MKTSYQELQKRHQDELTNFPIAYAFSEEQLKDALEKLGATREEVVTVFNHGDIVKKTDAPALLAMFKRQREELAEAMKDKEFAEAAFLYEMDNHEYAINWSGDDDVLACFNMSREDVVKLGLDDAYRNARRAHMKHAEEWGVI